MVLARRSRTDEPEMGQAEPDNFNGVDGMCRQCV